MNAYLVTFALAAVASLFVTRLCRVLAARFAWVDGPDVGRKLPPAPVPAIGGLAIFVSAAAAGAAAPMLSGAASEWLTRDAQRVAVLGVLCGAMMLVGLIDDVRPLRVSVKFALQSLVAALAWWAGIRIETLGTYWGDALSVQVLSLPLTVLWLVGITNAFNLLDGIDGLAAGAALFATTATLGVAITSQQVTTAIILAGVAGATAAFLRYNFNPASIFLGDSGSLFLGFAIAALAVESSQKSAAAFAVAVPIVSLGLPVLDTTVVVIRRMISGTSIFHADRRHIHHLLLDRGMSAREVAMWMYAVCGALALVSLLVASPYAALVGPVLVMLGIAVAIGVQQLHIPEMRALNAHVVREVRGQRSMLAGAAAVETMMGALSVANSGDEVLRALERGLVGSGAVSATLTLPTWLAPAPGGASGWRLQALSPLASTLEWIRQPAPAVTTLVLPLFRDGGIGTLSVCARTDSPEHVAIVNWISRDVADAIGGHLARVATPRPWVEHTPDHRDVPTVAV